MTIRILSLLCLCLITSIHAMNQNKKTDYNAIFESNIARWRDRANDIDKNLQEGKEQSIKRDILSLNNQIENIIRAHNQNALKLLKYAKDIKKLSIEEPVYQTGLFMGACKHIVYDIFYKKTNLKPRLKWLMPLYTIAILLTWQTNHLKNELIIKDQKTKELIKSNVNQYEQLKLKLHQKEAELENIKLSHNK